MKSEKEYIKYSFTASSSGCKNGLRWCFSSFSLQNNECLNDVRYSVSIEVIDQFVGGFTSSGKYEEPQWGYEPRLAETLSLQILPRDEETGYSYFRARHYDAVILMGWLSVDPMADKYPNISPYAYCAWNPVKLVDPDGREIWIKTNPYNSETPRIKWTNNGLFNADGSKYTGESEFVKQTANALDAIYSDKNSQFLLDFFMGNTQYDIELSESSITEYFEAEGGVGNNLSLQTIQPISFNPRLGLAQCKPDAEDEEFLAPFVCLLHEFGHAFNAVTDNKRFHERKSTPDNQYGNLEERYVIEHYEHPIAEKNEMLQRTSHQKGFLGLRLIQTSESLSPTPINEL